jgi:very-short-patch-repair endonuclease
VKKRPFEYYLRKFTYHHGNQYDYSLAEKDFSGWDSKITIICPIHGQFSQIVNNHAQGSKCPFCIRDTSRKTLQYLEQAKKVHNNKYDYSQTNIAMVKTILEKIIIHCPEHGEFKQELRMHALGQQCPKCSYKNRNPYADLDTLIQKAQLIHRNAYDYSKCHEKYKGTHSKIEIICPSHGSFFPTFKSHIYRQAKCPSCQVSKGENAIMVILEFHEINYISQKTFENLIGRKRPLKFDFYLPDFNTCLEYDGEQHFEPIKLFGGEKAFEEAQKRDKIKNDFCEKNGIQLIRISYRDKIIHKLKPILGNKVQNFPEHNPELE